MAVEFINLDRLRSPVANKCHHVAKDPVVRSSASGQSLWMSEGAKRLGERHIGMPPDLGICWWALQDLNL